MTNTGLEREIEQRLSEHEARYTRGRQAVVSTLSRSDGPLSASELHDELRDNMPLSSLYRSLAVLEGAGILVPHFGQGVTRYELAEWLTGHHHHFVCIACGAVDDVELPDELEAQVDKLVDRIGSIGRFSPTDHSLEIEGHCVRCR